MPETEDGFPEVQEQTHYDAGADPPHSESFDPPHLDDSRDPPHWEDGFKDMLKRSSFASISQIFMNWHAF